MTSDKTKGQRKRRREGRIRGSSVLHAVSAICGLRRRGQHTHDVVSGDGYHRVRCFSWQPIDFCFVEQTANYGFGSANGSRLPACGRSPPLGLPCLGLFFFLFFLSLNLVLPQAIQYHV